MTKYIDKLGDKEIFATRTISAYTDTLSAKVFDVSNSIDETQRAIFNNDYWIGGKWSEPPAISAITNSATFNGDDYYCFKSNIATGTNNDCINCEDINFISNKWTSLDSKFSNLSSPLKYHKFNPNLKFDHIKNATRMFKSFVLKQDRIEKVYNPMTSSYSEYSVGDLPSAMTLENVSTAPQMLYWGLRTTKFQYTT